MRRTHPLVLAAAVAALATPTAANARDDYRVELSGTMGYTFSEGIRISPTEIEDDDGDLIGVVRGLDVASGWSYGAGIDLLVTPEFSVGFNWAEQKSRLDAELQYTGKREITDLTVDNYHGVLTAHWPNPWRAATPFFMFGLGATQYRFSDIAGQEVSGDTRFSTTWGFGAKFYGDGPLGLRLMGRWTPTYIKSDSGGFWCNPWGCWQSVEHDYSNQFELVGSVLARF